MPAPETPRSAEDIEAELESLTPPDPDYDEEEGQGNDKGEGDADTPSPEEAARIEAETTAAAATAQAEQEAGRKGWVPKERFKGDPATWVDAKTFLERGERFTANLQREITALQKKIDGFEGTKAAFAKFYTEQLERKDRELKSAIAELRIRRSEAIMDGEHEAVLEIEDRIELLRDQQKTLKDDVTPEKAEPEKVKPDAEAPVVDPVILEWIDDGNKWFDDDPRLRAFAIATGDQLINNGETARGRKLLDKISAIIKEEFPRKFRVQQEPTPPAKGQVESDTNTVAGKGSTKTEKDLPPEDFKLMKQFIADGLTTKEKFLKSYFS